MLYSEIFKLLLKWFLGPVGEYQTHTTRSVGSNPTHGVEVSGAEFATEVGDGGGGAVLCALGVEGENITYKILFASYDATFDFFIIQKSDNFIFFLFSILIQFRIILNWFCIKVS